MEGIKLTNCIGKSFYKLYYHILNNVYTHYWLKGGRGSLKSSFIAIMIVLDIISDEKSNAICFRKFGNTLLSSVYNQIFWAINILGVQNYFSTPKKIPVPIVYLPTGQKILFWGMDDPQKLKSIKIIKGYLKNVWFEELEQFCGMEEIRNVCQSILRGGDIFRVFYSYNPPKSVNSWVNSECLIPKNSRIIHHTTYLDAPVDWLGKRFILEAEELKKNKPEFYKHEYLGIITGTGGEVFTNVKSRRITDLEISKFDNLRQGIDWGYSLHPFAFVKMHYDLKKRDLYIFDELVRVHMSDIDAMKILRTKVNRNVVIVADSNENKTIDKYANNGFYIEGAVKGSGSRNPSFKFLQRETYNIYIDPVRCRNTLREFINYEYQKKRNGEFIAEYPKINDDCIDAVRYALEIYIKNTPSIFDVL